MPNYWTIFRTENQFQSKIITGKLDVEMKYESSILWEQLFKI